VALQDDLARIADAVTAHAGEGESVVGVLACEPRPGSAARVYLCALGRDGGDRGWIAVDDEARPLGDRALVRDAVAISALCEVAAEAAFPGDLDELRAQLVQLRLTERPPGIETAETAAAALQRTVGAPPQLATAARLDAIAAAARQLEDALGEAGDGSPFTVAMRGAQGAVEDLWHEVEAGYRLPLA
jgi:hypothetical protein